MRCMRGRIHSRWIRLQAVQSAAIAWAVGGFYLCQLGLGCISRVPRSPSVFYGQEENSVLFRPNPACSIGAILELVSLLFFLKKKKKKKTFWWFASLFKLFVVCLHVFLHVCFFCSVAAAVVDLHCSQKNKKKNNLNRSSWTAAFNLSLTGHLCLGDFSTTGLLWLQLSTPIMYFGFWLLLFVLNWLRGYTRHGGGYSISTSSSFKLTLLEHLVDNDSHNDDTVASDVAANNSQSSPKALCRRFRFLRALEFLLLFSYETLTEQALQLVNCISVGSCGRVLAGYPDVACPSNAAYIPLLIVAVLILVYAAVFPVGLFLFLRKLKVDNPGKADRDSDDKNGDTDHDNENRSSDDNDDRSHVRSFNNTLSTPSGSLTDAKFGVFYSHYKQRFWWWEVQVQKLCEFFFGCFFDQYFAHWKLWC